MANWFDKLQSAAIYGDIEEIRKLQKEGVDIHADDDIVFRLACAHGKLELVKFLLKNDVDVHIKSDWGIRAACAYGHWKLINFLLDNGADIYADNESALYCAAGKGNLEVVKYLVEEKGFCIDDASITNACTQGHVDVLNYLFERKKPDNFDMDFFINYICKNETEERYLLVVKFLLDKGAVLKQEYGTKQEMMQKIIAYERKRTKAANKIGSWWIPICYDVNRECGKRMMERSWLKVKAMYDEKFNL